MKWIRAGVFSRSSTENPHTSSSIELQCLRLYMDASEWVSGWENCHDSGKDEFLRRDKRMNLREVRKCSKSQA